MARRRKKARRTIKLTPEGWVFLVILGFIATGAVLRNVNVLILMSGLMFAPLIINWRIGILRLKSLSAKRSLSHRIYAKQFFNVQWIGSNSAKFPAWNVQIHDEIRQGEQLQDSTIVTGDGSQGDSRATGNRAGILLRLYRFFRPRKNAESSNVGINFVQIGAYDSQVVSYRVYFACRGKYIVGPATLMTSFPFGLVASRIRIPQKKEFYVAPELGKLTPVWDRRVQSAVVGSDAIQRKRGLEEDEFYALRPWRSGDSKKQIHWRTSAKFGQPIVRQYDQQDNRDFAMLLDLHFDGTDPRGSGPTECPQCETALSFAATVVLHLGIAVQGRIAVGVCGSRNEICCSRNHREITDRVMQIFAIAEPADDPDIIDTLLDLSRSVSGSTPLYVISSREKPDYLSAPIQRETDITAQLAGSASPDPVLLEEARRISRLKNIGPTIRWIRVGSDEFQRLFATNDVGQSCEPQIIEELTEKWVSNNAPC